MKISVAAVLPDVASSLRGLDSGVNTLQTNAKFTDAAGVQQLGQNFIARVDSTIAQMNTQVGALTAKDLRPRDVAKGEQLLKELRVQTRTVKVELDFLKGYARSATADVHNGVVQLSDVRSSIKAALEAADTKPVRTTGQVNSGASDAARSTGTTPHYGTDGLDELGNATRNDRGHVGNDGQGYSDAGEASGARAHDDYSDVVLY